MPGNSIRGRAKNLWIKGMRTVGNTAATIASNTKFKVDEMILQNRRKELADDLSGKAYSLWVKGASFPPEMTLILEEIRKLDNRLSDMRAERSGPEITAPIPAEPANEAADTTEEKAETESDDHRSTEMKADTETSLNGAITGASQSVQSEINGCFDPVASVDKMAEKVNSSLNQLTSKIRSFSPEPSDPEQK